MESYEVEIDGKTYQGTELLNIYFYILHTHAHTHTHSEFVVIYD